MAKWNKNKLKAAGKALKKAGSTGSDGVKDTDVVHVNRAEKAMLSRYGGSGRKNPKTGLKEYASFAEAHEAEHNDTGSLRQGGKSSGTNDSNASKSVPTASTGPLAKGQALGNGQALAGASSGEALGSGGNADATPGGIPGAHVEKQPGDVPAVTGADAIGIGARVLGGVTGAVGSALSQGLTGEDATEKLVGPEHFGKQVGWSGTGDETGTRPGKGGAETLGTSSTTKAPSAPAAPKPPATSGSTGGSTTGPGGTITVNPDGTVRTVDTSVAGLRAQRRYGPKTTPAAAT